MSLKNKNTWLLLSLLWVGVMFFLSHQNGTDTFNTSHGFTVYLANLFHVDPELLHTIVRKAAHLGLYFILTLFLYGYQVLRGKAGWLALVAAVIFSVLDEGTKPFIPGRHCDGEDILLNDVGAVLGYISALYFGKKCLSKRDELA